MPACWTTCSSSSAIVGLDLAVDRGLESGYPVDDHHLPVDDRDDEKRVMAHRRSAGCRRTAPWLRHWRRARTAAEKVPGRRGGLVVDVLGLVIVVAIPSVRKALMDQEPKAAVAEHGVRVGIDARGSPGMTRRPRLRAPADTPGCEGTAGSSTRAFLLRHHYRAGGRYVPGVWPVVRRNAAMNALGLR